MLYFFQIFRNLEQPFHFGVLIWDRGDGCVKTFANLCFADSCGSFLYQGLFHDIENQCRGIVPRRNVKNRCRDKKRTDDEGSLP